LLFVERGGIDMKVQRYRAEDLMQFGNEVLVRIGFSHKQAGAVARVLVEADLRADPTHGLTGGISLDEFIAKIYNDDAQLGFKDLRSPSSQKTSGNTRPL
jgi:hypothetical protein